MQDARKAVSANAHVKALLSRLASELGGSVVDEGRQASTISLKTALAVHKVVQNIEVHIKVRQQRQPFALACCLSSEVDPELR